MMMLLLLVTLLWLPAIKAVLTCNKCSTTSLLTCRVLYHTQATDEVAASIGHAQSHLHQVSLCFQRLRAGWWSLQEHQLDSNEPTFKLEELIGSSVSSISIRLPLTYERHGRLMLLRMIMLSLGMHRWD